MRVCAWFGLPASHAVCRSCLSPVWRLCRLVMCRQSRTVPPRGWGRGSERGKTWFSPLRSFQIPPLAAQFKGEGMRSRKGRPDPSRPKIKDRGRPGRIESGREIAPNPAPAAAGAIQRGPVRACDGRAGIRARTLSRSNWRGRRGGTSRTRRQFDGLSRAWRGLNRGPGLASRPGGGFVSSSS